MSLKSASTLVEVPGVTIAVEHLQELELRMKTEEFGFSDQDVQNIDKITDALCELQGENGKLEEKLETQTIKASVLRHTLQFLPDKIKSEIQAVVDLARDSNAEELTNLQDTLDDINKKIKYFNDRFAELEKENTQLHPERDRVREEHEDIISQLNQRMAEKASQQITLNETRDKLRETNQKIVELEEGILQLKEELIQERADARMEKKRLKKAVYDTTLKTREQKEVNAVKKKELDALQQKVFESESKVDELRKSVRKFETSLDHLEGRERALFSQLNREIQTNEQMEQKGKEMAVSLEEQEESYSKLKTELEDNIKGLKKEIKSGEKNKKKQSHEKGQMETVLADKMHTRQLDEGRVKEQNNILQEAKQDLACKAEDAAQLRQENMDMEQRIKDLGETHESVVATYQKQIEEIREQLAKERRQRMDLQGHRDTVQKEVDDFKIETQKYMNEMNKKIGAGKTRHDELTREGTTLQKQIRQDEESIRKLQDNINRATTDFGQFKSTHEGDVSRLEKEISDMQIKTKDMQETILERSPSFEELEKGYEQRTIDYETMKKDIVGLKNKKLGLEDSMKVASRDVEKLITPTAKLRNDLKEKQNDSIQQLKRQAQQRTEVEHKIYATGCKLRTAMEENEHFEDENKNLTNLIASVNGDMKQIDSCTAQLEKELSNLKEQLMQEWMKDKVLEKEFEARDQVLVEELGKLLDKTGKREHVISNITAKLQSELRVLAEFLDNVAKRRPKDSSVMRGKRTVKPTPKPQVAEPVSGMAVVIDTVAQVNKENNLSTDHNDVTVEVLSGRSESEPSSPMKNS